MLILIKKSNVNYKLIEFLKEKLNLNNIKKKVYRLEEEIKDILGSNEKVIKNLKIYRWII